MWHRCHKMCNFKGCVIYAFDTFKMVCNPDCCSCYFSVQRNFGSCIDLMKKENRGVQTPYHKETKEWIVKPIKINKMDVASMVHMMNPMKDYS